MTQPSLFDEDAPPAREAPAEKSSQGKTKRAPPPLPECFAEPHTLSAVFPPYFRAYLANELAALLAEVDAGTASADEVYRYLRGALYVLTGAELAKLTNNLIHLLRGTP